MIKGLSKKNIITLAIGLIIIYIIVGAVAPFLVKNSVNEEFKDSFNTNTFYNDDIGVDRAKLIETGEDSLHEKLRLLNRAKDKIIFSTYDIRDCESTKDMLAVLLAKAEEGIKVKIIVDGINGMIRMVGRSIFYALSNHPNVEIKFYNPFKLFQPWKSQGRMHDKYILVDDIGYIIGGRNAHDCFVGNYESKSKSLDTEVLVYNSAHGTEQSKESSVKEVENYFNQIWDNEDTKLFHKLTKGSEHPQLKQQRKFLKDRYVTLNEEQPTLFNNYSYEEETVPTNKVTLISNETHVYGKEPWLFYSLVRLMEGARECVIIQSPYAVFNDYILESLSEVAKDLKDFKLFINSVENGGNFIASSDYLRNKKNIIERGISINEYNGGISSHGKALVLDDDISAVGSFNFDMRSTYINSETMVVINSVEFTNELKYYINSMLEHSSLVVDENNYETPPHVKINRVHPIKKFLWWIVGIVIQPVRFLI